MLRSSHQRGCSLEGEVPHSLSPSLFFFLFYYAAWQTCCVVHVSCVISNTVCHIRSCLRQSSDQKKKKSSHQTGNQAVLLLLLHKPGIDYREGIHFCYFYYYYFIGAVEHTAWCMMNDEMGCLDLKSSKYANLSFLGLKI